MKNTVDEDPLLSLFTHKEGGEKFIACEIVQLVMMVLDVCHVDLQLDVL